MKEPKIHGLPPLPEGHEFLMEGEKRREGLLVWNGAKTWAKPWRDPCEPLDESTIYCAPVRKPYAERQAEWVAKHGIKVGSKVRVTRKGGHREDGWTDTWLLSMDGYVGMVCRVEDIHKNGVRLEEPDANFPYFVLESIQDIAPGHNPAGLTVDQVEEGWRLMTLDEINDPDCPFKDKCQGWLSDGRWSFLYMNGCNEGITYRVRTEPKRMPLTADDWAGEGCWWVRPKMESTLRYLITSILPDGVGYDRGVFTFAYLMDTYERSRDLITWEPCSKPE